MNNSLFPWLWYLLEKEVIILFQPQMQQCINQSFQIANQIRGIASNLQDSSSRYALTEAARHVEESIKECNNARIMLGGQYGNTTYF